MGGIYWDQAVETMDRGDLEQLQLERFNRTLERAGMSRFYKGRLPEKINSLDALKDLPFTEKSDLRNSFPEGMLSVPRDEIVRLHSSS